MQEKHSTVVANNCVNLRHVLNFNDLDEQSKISRVVS